MNDPRLCIIGSGSLSTRRIYPYIGAAGAQLVGCCDLDLAKAQRNASRFGGAAYTDLDLMLAEQKPDGVIICVGPQAHADLARRVLALGYPVYTEKPPALTAADALAVVRAAHTADLLCMTAFKKRYNIAYCRARHWLDQFPPDDHYSLSIDYCSKQYSNDSPHRMFLFDFAIHVIDLAGYLFGDASEVFAFSKGPDAYAVSLQFTSGAVGSLNLADGRSFAIPTEEVELTIRGGNFMTIHNSSIYRITENEKPIEWREPPTFTSAGDSGLDTGHLAELLAFTDALRGNPAAVRSTIYQSYKSMCLYEAIARSAETHAVVPIHYESD